MCSDCEAYRLNCKKHGLTRSDGTLCKMWMMFLLRVDVRRRQWLDAYTLWYDGYGMATFPHFQSNYL